MAGVVYLDSSALVKLVIREPESPALRRRLRRYRRHVSAALARTEVLRAVRRANPAALSRANDVLRHVVLIELSEDLLAEAGTLDPVDLRTLDAIHLTAAGSLGSDLVALITYDRRQAASAASLGLPVESPAR